MNIQQGSVGPEGAGDVLTPMSNYSEKSVAELEKLISEHDDLMKRCLEERKRAETYLIQFGNSDESDIPPGQKEDWKAARRDLHNAKHIYESAENRKTEMEDTLKRKQQQQKVNVSTGHSWEGAASLAYQEGKSLEKNDSGEARKVIDQLSRISTTSTAKRKQLDLNLKKKLHELEVEYLESLGDIEKEIDALNDQFETKEDTDVTPIFKSSLRKLERKQELLEKHYQRKVKLLKSEADIARDELDLEEDDDQYLGSDEDRARSPSPKTVQKEAAQFLRPQSNVTPNFQTYQTGYQGLRSLEMAPSVPPYVTTGSGEPSYIAQPPRTKEDLYLEIATKTLQKLDMSEKRRERILPEFNGQAIQWNNFKVAYDKSTVELDLSNEDNLRRLQAVLKGEAMKEVQHLMCKSGNVPRIMSTLEEVFGKPEQVLDDLTRDVKSCKTVSTDDPVTVIEFGRVVEALLVNSECAGMTQYVNSPHLVQDLVEKLSSEMKKQWYHYRAVTNSGPPTLQTFYSWMNTHVRSARMQARTETIPKKKEERRGKGRCVIAAASEEDRGKKECFFCGSAKHLAYRCDKYKTLDDRWNRVKEKKVCFLCLRQKHFTDECKMEPCKIDGCGKKHHKLLHPTDDKKKKFRRKREERSASPTESEFDRISEDQRKLLNDLRNPNVPIDKPADVHGVKQVLSVALTSCLPIIPIYVEGPLGRKKVFALLDSGASVSVLESEIAAEIGLEGSEGWLSLNLFGNEARAEKSMIVDLKISGTHRHSQKFQITKARTVKKLGIPGVTILTEALKEKYTHLKEMKVSSCRNAVPQMVIGYDNALLFYADKVLTDWSNRTPSAFRSALGWYVNKTDCVVESMNYAVEVTPADVMMHEEMKRFWSLEGFGVTINPNSGRSAEDMRAMKMMEAHTRKIEDNRWETCLLWKDESCVLPNSKPMVLRRLHTMERKMDSNPEFAELCQKKFTEYIQKGYLVKTVNTDVQSRKGYLPWFFAYHPNKKPRLVYDAAAKALGRSFNDHLMKGPDLLQPLPEVLMRFRRHLIAVTADIKEMFHQVKLMDSDRPAQTLLYRGMERRAPPEEYEMTVLFFGSASSPSSAIYVKTRNAEKYKEKYPEIVEAISRDCYMDDFLSGADTVEAALELQQVVTRIHEAGGFPMVKWNSSNEEVFEAIPLKLRAEKEDQFRLCCKDDIELEKTLGLLWDPVKDGFVFNVKPKPQHMDLVEGEKVPTKREVTSILMSLFDPLGFVAPFRIKGHMILQEIWKSEIDWDEEISKEMNAKWSQWMSELPGLKDVFIPRKLTPISLFSCESIQLHIFVDASEEAYAAAAHLRADMGGRICTSFIFGKSRVAPLKKISVPRMELTAAVMGSRIATAVKKAYSNIQFGKTVFWSDSRTVLSWIRSPSARLKTFEANRVGEILETTNVMDWKWTPTKENPADAATRSNKLNLSGWLMSPEFLVKAEEFWPSEVKLDPDTEEENELMNVLVDHSECDPTEILPDISKFSSWYRLLRSTARIIVAVRIFKSKISRDKNAVRKPPHILKEDMDLAKKLWIRKSQRDSFHGEWKLLQEGKPILHSSKLFNLSPAINTDFIIYLNGKINNADVSTSVKNPPILDPNHPYTKLMVKWFHNLGRHWGQERVINELRQQVWIIDCRAAVRKCKAECLICKKSSARPILPEMGQLPEARVRESKFPHAMTGVDYFGPILVKVRRSTEKRWGVIYTCLATRAVFLDLVASLDTSDFLNSLTRFINLRKKPEHIFSDNGTNFVGAERELREKLEQFNQEKIRQHLDVNGIQWHFIPPAAPHFGGTWERLIMDVKKILGKILAGKEPSDDVLRTLFAEVTGIMNSRPITRASPDPNDYTCLTPNHLLNVECVVGASLTGSYQDHHRYMKSYERVQLLAKLFWERWSKEYLPWLAKRNKWNQRTEPVKVGELCIVLQDNAHRNDWKMGRIMATYPAKDGQVRFVDVEIAFVDPTDKKKVVKKTTLRRPTVKICPLRWNSDGSEVPWEGECGEGNNKNG